MISRGTLSMYRGDDFSIRYRLRTTDVNGNPGAYYNLTGCSVAAQVRAAEGDSNVLAEFTCSVVEPQYDPNIVGLVQLDMSGEDTKKLGSTTGPVGGFDIEITDSSGKVKTAYKVELGLEADYTNV